VQIRNRLILFRKRSKQTALAGTAGRKGWTETKKHSVEISRGRGRGRGRGERERGRGIWTGKERKTERVPGWVPIGVMR
jgi:hypothetical protein